MLEKLKYLFILLFVSGICQAAGWHDAGKVTRLHTGHGDTTSVTGAIYFTTENQFNNPSCGSPNAGYTFDENNRNSDRIYSLLLSAYLSKTPVHIYVTDSCLASRPKVDAVQYNSGVAL